MLAVSGDEFERLIGQALDELPQKYTTNMQNVVFVHEDEPTLEQRVHLELHDNETLYGLYEGIPLTRRGASYNLVLPDKITIFRLPMLRSSATMPQLQAQIKHTLWHEIAHHFGLGHGRIHELERKHNLR